MKVVLKVTPGESLARLSAEVFAAGGRVLRGYQPDLLIDELSSSATLTYGTQVQANVDANEVQERTAALVLARLNGKQHFGHVPIDARLARPGRAVHRLNDLSFRHRVSGKGESS